jgi:callose synthase
VSIDEFRNFLQRIDFKLKDEEELKERLDEICNWAGKMSSAIL